MPVGLSPSGIPGGLFCFKLILFGEKGKQGSGPHRPWPQDSSPAGANR